MTIRTEPTRARKPGRAFTSDRSFSETACAGARPPREEWPRADASVRRDIVARARRRLAAGFYDQPACVERAIDAILENDAGAA